MPKIHFIGDPRDLYRYRTFLEVIIDNKETWGVSIDYNSMDYCQKKQSVISRKLNSLIKLVKNILCIATADYVYFPPMVLLGGRAYIMLIWICNLMKKKVIFDFYISVYDTMVLDRQIVEPNSKYAKKLAELDHWGHTRHVSIYLNACEAKRYRSLNNLEYNDQAVIIPLSISQRPTAQLNYYKNNNSETLNMIWWGTYIPLHGLDKIINAVAILVSKGLNVHLYIMGNNPTLSKRYKDIIKNTGDLSNYVSISDEVTFSNGRLMPFLIEKCDLAFGAFGDSEKAKTVILNKAIEAVAMKIPVLTQYSEAFQEFFDPDTTMFYCDNTAEKIAEKVMQIMSLNVSTIEDRVNKCYKIYEDNFSIEASKRLFNNLLKSLV